MKIIGKNFQHTKTSPFKITQLIDWISALLSIHKSNCLRIKITHRTKIMDLEAIIIMKFQLQIPLRHNHIVLS